MKVLVIGGTGMIGSHLVRHLIDATGHEVIVGARHPTTNASLVSEVPVMIGDYTRGDFGADQLGGFDAVVMAAANDVRHLPPEVDVEKFWRETQIDGVPRVAASARSAGVRRFIQIGSYYHQVLPELAESNAYVRARRSADLGTVALGDDEFLVSTLNPPSIVGAIPGPNLVRFQRMTAWARGELPELGDFAPKGGTNYMSVMSLAECVAGALENAVSGESYLVGDENLTFAEFFQLFVDAAGVERTVSERDEEHPLLPDEFIVQGRGVAIRYEPDPATVAQFGYTRGDVRRAVQEIVDMVDRTS